MSQTTSTMKAIAIDSFGGAEKLKLQMLPVPQIDAHEVLIRVEAAGVGEWDPFEREGGYAEATGGAPKSPYVLGSEGAGTIVQVGAQVTDFKTGDRVYAPSFLNPKGGFYAEFAAVDAGLVSHIPDYLSVEQAGAMSGVGVTALRGLEDMLNIQRGESVLIFGASGGIGHLAVQIARHMGARVFSVASGENGVALAAQLGSDQAVNGRAEDVVAAVRQFAPDGVDAALLTAGGDVAEQALQCVRAGGRVAYPNGIQPEPEAHAELEMNPYNGEPDAGIVRRFARIVQQGAFSIHVAQSFPLERAGDAHRALDEHYLGKLVLRINDNRRSTT